MNQLGLYLKQQRQRLNLSMSEVHEQTGITDSKLSRVERGEGRPLDPYELKKIAELYRVNIVLLYLMAGYISESDLKDYRLGFSRASLLSDEEHENIQTQINLMTRGRTESNNDL